MEKGLKENPKLYKWPKGYRSPKKSARKIVVQKRVSYVVPKEPEIKVDKLTRKKGVKDLRDGGWKLQKIANLFGISKQRVFQIINEK